MPKTTKKTTTRKTTPKAKPAVKKPAAKKPAAKKPAAKTTKKTPVKKAAPKKAEPTYTVGAEVIVHYPKEGKNPAADFAGEIIKVGANFGGAAVGKYKDQIKIKFAEGGDTLWFTEEELGMVELVTPKAPAKKRKPAKKPPVVEDEDDAEDDIDEEDDDEDSDDEDGEDEDEDDEEGDEEDDAEDEEEDSDEDEEDNEEDADDDEDGEDEDEEDDDGDEDDGDEDEEETPPPAPKGKARKGGKKDDEPGWTKKVVNTKKTEAAEIKKTAKDIVALVSKIDPDSQCVHKGCVYFVGLKKCDLAKMKECLRQLKEMVK